MSVNIFYAGDSTVAQNSIRTYPQTGIGQTLPLYLKQLVTVHNHAINGRSTKSFIDESRLAAIYNELRAGDFLLIQFGHNDEKVQDETRYTSPFGEYQENLGKFINVARNRNAYPVLITPLYRRLFDSSGTLSEHTHGEYPDAMKEVGARLQVPVIDLCEKSRQLLLKTGEERSRRWFMNFPAGEYRNYPEGKTDNTHLCYEGAIVFAGLVADGLRELGGIYADLLKKED